MKHCKIRNLMVIGLVLTGLAPLALSAAEPEDIIKYRKNVMKAIGGHTSAAGAIVQGKVGYKTNLVEHARALKAMTKDIPGLFPKDSDFGDTNAKDGVWSKRAEFEKAASEARNKVEIFAMAAEGGNPMLIEGSFKDMGESCKSCHKDFRKEDK